MPLSKRARLPIAFALLAIAMSGAVVTLRLRHASSDLDLLRKATRLKSTANLFTDNSRYFWINNRELLAFPSGPGPSGYHVVAHNIALGTTTSLVALNKAYTPHRSCMLQSVEIPSPNGKWLLTSENFGDGWCGFKTFSTDGSSKKELKLAWPIGCTTWLPDSSGTAGIERGTPALVLRVCRLNGKNEKFVLPALEGMEGAQLLGITHDEHIVLEQMSPNSKNEVAVAEVSLHPAPTLVHHLVVPLPNGNSWDYFKLSPDGKRISYTVNIHREKPRSTRVQRIFSFFQPESPPSNEEQLWVARLDGTERRQVGTIDAAKHFLLNSYRWTPDSKRISFICDDALWTIPVG
jgi:hypothetical protein